MTEAQPSGTAPEKKGGAKTALMVGVILVVEAVVIIGAIMFIGGKPGDASAMETEQVAELTADDKIVEALVLEAKMPNNKTGVTYIYGTEIYVQVKQRHVEKVKAEIEQFQNEIKAEITAIWRTAEPQYFQEPKLDNLTRRVHGLLNERFGMDREREEPIVTKVVIVMSTGFRIDS